MPQLNVPGEGQMQVWKLHMIVVSEAFVCDAHMGLLPLLQQLQTFFCCAGIKAQPSIVLGNNPSTEQMMALQQQPWSKLLPESEARYQLQVLGDAAVGGPHPQSFGPDLLMKVHLRHAQMALWPLERAPSLWQHHDMGVLHASPSFEVPFEALWLSSLSNDA